MKSDFCGYGVWAGENLLTPSGRIKGLTGPAISTIKLPTFLTRVSRSRTIGASQVVQFSVERFNLMSNAWLRCMITPGQFSCEYAVEGQTFAGEGFSLFACDYDLKFPANQPAGGRVQGWIRVTVVKTAGSRALVQLPKSTMENGDTVTVDCNNLKTDTPCLETAS